MGYAKLLGYRAVLGGLEDLLDQWEDDGSVWLIGTPAEYAIHVHEGTSRMEGRPFLQDAIDDVVGRKGDQIATQVNSTAELKERLAVELEKETKQKITEYGAVDTGFMRNSTEAVKLR